MKLKKLVEIGEKAFIDTGKKEDINDLYLLLTHITGISKLDIIAGKEKEITKEDFDIFNELLKIRVDGKPVQYITGSASFYGYDFYVDERVLIPRFDTEILVEEVIRTLELENKVFMDMCCGTGCVGIALLKESGVTEGIFVDKSDGAIEITRRNADKLEVSEKIQIIKSDLFENVSSMKVDFIVSNPPYIKTDDIMSLDEEVRSEPIVALDGGRDGLSFYDEISKNAKDFLIKGGSLFFEIGFDQADEVTNLMKKYGYSDVQVIKDLNGNDRVVRGIYNV